MSSRLEEVEEKEYDGGLDKDDKRLWDLANKLFTTSAAIKVAFENCQGLIGRKKQTFGKEYYTILTGEQNSQLDHELTRVNELLGTSHSLLDSYISFENSTPKFENLFNIFYLLYEKITRHRQTIFFKVHVRDEQLYIYPYFSLYNGLQKLIFLLNRLCGTLKVGGEYIIDQPAPPRHTQDIDSPYGYNRGYYPHQYRPNEEMDWRGQLDKDIRKKSPRDIGDSLDKV